MGQTQEAPVRAMERGRGGGRAYTRYQVLGVSNEANNTWYMSKIATGDDVDQGHNGSVPSAVVLRISEFYVCILNFYVSHNTEERTHALVFTAPHISTPADIHCTLFLCRHFITEGTLDNTPPTFVRLNKV